MTVSSRIAFGFAFFRGFQLAVLTLPWIRQKARRADGAESERSLILMVGSRSILLGVAMVVLAFMNLQQALGWVLVADGLLQLFDTVQAVVLRKGKLAILPAALFVLDGLASLVLLP